MKSEGMNHAGGKHYRTLFAVGAIVCCVGLSMVLPLAWGLVQGDAGTLPLLYSMLATLAAGGLLLLAFRNSPRQDARGKDIPLTHREGMAIVSLGWVAAGLCGALPYLFGGVCHTVTDAVFEAVSGFTTTGASILTNIEAVPESLLLWRSLTHWLGGMGIIVLSLAILPFLGVGGMQLYKAEAPGPTPDKLKPRIKDTAAILWKVYVGMSAIQTVLLMLGGMSFFDALCHTFGTMATGGFSTRNSSVAAYESPYIYWVITVFMFLAGMNFSLHYKLLLGQAREVWKDGELRFYGLVVAGCTLWIAWNIWGTHYATPFEALTQGAFQVASIITTTGFATADFEQWPPLSQLLLVLLMFVGGCAGSTGGGMKCVRLLLMLKHCSMELVRLVHPRAVRHVKLGRRNVPDEVLSGAWGFFGLYMFCYVATSAALAAMDLDIVTSFTATLACISNVGPGFGTVGPAENFFHLPALAKVLLTWCMLLGRLEIYTVLILFVPEFWRK
ncbi:TrkH family potassium uptake protein [Megalodesulfovibrio paquesii]